jgi:glycosyltransferase involved in cell wall biosynthesis
LRRAGIGHVHAHFAGLAARTAWWLQKFHGVSYSFTGHANDIFCETDYPISNADLVRDARFIVTESDFARQWMETKYPRARGKTFRVYNGMDDDFPPRQASDEVPRILSVGRLVEKKGFADLIEACRQLRAREISFVCSIVGEGPLEAELRAQIDRASLGSAVRLLGPRSQIGVRQLLAGSQLFVLPCVPEADGGSDNLPTVVMEAMMCGLPIVSTRVAGIPEMLEHGENGLLVAPGDPAALALAMEQLLRDDSVAQLFAARARRTALGKFAIQTTTRALKQLLVRRAGVNPPPSALELDPGLPRGLFRRWFR